MAVRVVDHPLVRHKLGILRTASTATHEFRTVANELGSGLINCQKAENLVSCAQGGRHEPTFLPFCRTTRTYQALLPTFTWYSTGR